MFKNLIAIAAFSVALTVLGLSVVHAQSPTTTTAPTTTVTPTPTTTVPQGAPQTGYGSTAN
jgi:hypothetical protein